MKTYNNFITENYRLDTGPLMNAKDWIKPQKLSSMLKEKELFGEKLTLVKITKFMGKSRIAIVRSDLNKNSFPKGMNTEHSFYYDTGRGSRQTDETISPIGVIDIKDDGTFTTKGDVDLNTKVTLFVFK